MEGFSSGEISLQLGSLLRGASPVKQRSHFSLVLESALHFLDVALTSVYFFSSLVPHPSDGPQRRFPCSTLHPGSSFGVPQVNGDLPNAVEGVLNKCSTQDQSANAPVLGRGCWFGAERGADPRLRWFAARCDSSRRCEHFLASSPHAPRRAPPQKRSPGSSDPLAVRPTVGRRRSSPECRRQANPLPDAVVLATRCARSGCSTEAHQRCRLAHRRCPPVQSTAPRKMPRLLPPKVRRCPVTPRPAPAGIPSYPRLDQRPLPGARPVTNRLPGSC